MRKKCLWTNKHSKILERIIYPRSNSNKIPILRKKRAFCHLMRKAQLALERPRWPSITLASYLSLPQQPKTSPHLPMNKTPINRHLQMIQYWRSWSINTISTSRTWRDTVLRLRPKHRKTRKLWEVATMTRKKRNRISLLVS